MQEIDIRTLKRFVCSGLTMSQLSRDVLDRVADRTFRMGPASADVDIVAFLTWAFALAGHRQVACVFEICSLASF